MSDSDGAREARVRRDIRRFREDRGLPTTDALVEHFLAETRAGHHFGGLWHTPDEEKVFFATQERLDAASKVVGAYTDGHPDTFAGTWVDWRDGGEIHVKFTRDVAEHRSALRALLPVPDMLHVHGARHSFAELLALSHHVFEADEELKIAGIDLKGAYPDEEDNRLHIEVVAPDADTARAFFRDRYGDRVVVEYEPTDT